MEEDFVLVLNTCGVTPNIKNEELFGFSLINIIISAYQVIKDLEDFFSQTRKFKISMEAFFKVINQFMTLKIKKKIKQIFRKMKIIRKKKSQNKKSKKIFIQEKFRFIFFHIEVYDQMFIISQTRGLCYKKTRNLSKKIYLNYLKTKTKNLNLKDQIRSISQKNKLELVLGNGHLAGLQIFFSRIQETLRNKDTFPASLKC
ncbi:hypothetical protein BpHYR1_015955 [Brachionus plicatilis]|uniref:Uncharacterized protein n=1 Tax=Brachionus plicatilis TaxID=10195 RepID=A0A3M7PMG2_BRAPC|nr:hypothetical protein BpHYR1_015955 [Brachionus plicatilis]